MHFNSGYYTHLGCSAHNSSTMLSPGHLQVSLILHKFLRNFSQITPHGRLFFSYFPYIEDILYQLFYLVCLPLCPLSIFSTEPEYMSIPRHPTQELTLNCQETKYALN